MMTAEVVRLAPAGRDKQWPLLVPRTILTKYQPVIGGQATLLWLNLYELVEAGVETSVVSVLSHVAARMAVDPETVEQAAVTLEQARLLQRTDGRWTLLWPATAMGPGIPAISDEAAGQGPILTTTPASTDDVAVQAEATFSAPPQPEIAAAAETAADVQTDADNATGWNSDEAALQAVVQFYHQRIGMLGPSQFEKLRFWVEDQGMSSDVVALAIEETVQSAPTPRMAYVEGVLRNWYNDGIRTLADLQKSKRVRSQEVPPTTEGTPNAASFDAVDRDAVRRWKELYSDEYDD